MSLKDTLQADMKAALKGGEKERLKVVRMVLAAIKQQEIDQRTELDDAALLGVVTKMVKQRRDSITQFNQGGRADLAAVEEAEIEVLEAYLPEQLSADEIDALIDEAISNTGASSMRDMGKVMGLLKPKLEGRADLGPVSGKVKARLG